MHLLSLEMEVGDRENRHQLPSTVNTCFDIVFNKKENEERHVPSSNQDEVRGIFQWSKRAKKLVADLPSCCLRR